MIRPPSKRAAASTHSTFNAEVEAVLARLRIAAGGLLHAGPVKIERATELQRALDVGTAIAWQLFRLGTAESAFAAGEFVPRTGSMRRLLDAARDHKFKAAAIAELDAAYLAFDNFVQHHAGDRDTFDAMVAPLGEQTNGQIELRHRRAAFRGNAQVWGFQADTVYRACICRPTHPSAPEQVAIIAGFVDLRQLRPTMPVPLLRRKVFVEQHAELQQFDVSARGPFLLDPFSTIKPADLHPVSEQGAVTETLTLSGVGRDSSQTCFLTDTILQGFTRPNDVPFSMGLLTCVPCETLVIDLLVERGHSDPRSVRVRTHGNPSNVDSAMTRADQFLLPTRESGVHLGNSIDALQAPEVAQCPAIVTHVLQRNNWADVQFDIYRCRVRYPVLHSAISLEAAVAARTTP